MTTKELEQLKREAEAGREYVKATRAAYCSGLLASGNKTKDRYWTEGRAHAEECIRKQLDAALEAYNQAIKGTL